MTFGSRSRLRGFSLVEILVCMAILVVLAAITFPIARAAKLKSYEGVCASNLHQMWLATSLYREDYSPHSETGNMYEMGLPTSDWVGAQMDKNKAFTCPLTAKPFRHLQVYHYMVGVPEYKQVNDEWIDTVNKYGSNSMIFVDFCHGDLTTLYTATYPHVGLGVSLGGQFRKQTKKGSLINTNDMAKWWAGGP